MRTRYKAAGCRADGANAQGFTLIELMTVVAVISVLATVAIPVFLRYVKKSRTVEAVEALDKIAAGAQVYWQHSHDLPRWPDPLPSPGDHFAPPMTHEQACRDGDGRIFPDAAAWNAEPWRSLLFQMTEKSYYRYGWIPEAESSAGSTGGGTSGGGTSGGGTSGGGTSGGEEGEGVAAATGAMVHAWGDLDCDNWPSMWVMRLEMDTEGGLSKLGPWVQFGEDTE